MNFESAEEFYKDVVYRELESSEDHNIFTNYNNFSRDYSVFEETFKECWKVMKFIEQDKALAWHQRDWYAKKENPPAVIALKKMQDERLDKWQFILMRKYEKLLKDNNIGYSHLAEEATEELENKTKE